MVIDLQALIALLTAIAAATSAVPLSSDRSTAPSDGTCLDPSSIHADERSGAHRVDADRQPAAERAAPAAPADKSASVGADGDATDSYSRQPDRTTTDGSPDRGRSERDTSEAESDGEALDGGPEQPQWPPSPSADRVDPSTANPSGCEPPEREKAGLSYRRDSTRNGPRRSAESRVPADVLDLTNWYLTLPTGVEGDPDTVHQPDLDTYTSRYFQPNAAKDGVVFTANADGVTTKNSSYPRTELREMNGRQKAAWSNTVGVHTLTATEAVTALPEAKPETVTAQIHDGRDDVVQIRLEGPRLMVQYDDGAKDVTLDPNYQLGTPYEIQIVAAEGHVQISYNGTKKADLPLAGSDWYFKAGAYVQSNTGTGDTASAVGQVVIYSLTLTHSPENQDQPH